jgi:hypothetical protein
VSVQGQHLLLLQILPKFWSRFQLASKQRHKCFKGACFLLYCSMKEWSVMSLTLNIFSRFWSRTQLASKQRHKCFKGARFLLYCSMKEWSVMSTSFSSLFLCSCVGIAVGERRPGFVGLRGPPRYPPWGFPWTRRGSYQLPLPVKVIFFALQRIYISFWACRAFSQNCGKDKIVPKHPSFVTHLSVSGESSRPPLFESYCF